MNVLNSSDKTDREIFISPYIVDIKAKMASVSLVCKKSICFKTANAKIYLQIQLTEAIHHI